jgi:hypothetical protein
MADSEPTGSSNSLISFLLQVEGYYASLMRQALPVEAGLGGRLLCVGELDEDGRALMVAGNIAGVASLAVRADPASQKQAIREGVADFLVTNLDEAIRILKNEIRKREAVAVCVGVAPETIEKEMLERGVLPDLVRDPGAVGTPDSAVVFGGRPAVVAPLGPAMGESVLSWSVDEAPAQRLPRLDAIAMQMRALARRLRGGGCGSLRAIWGGWRGTCGFCAAQQLRQRRSRSGCERAWSRARFPCR